MPRKKLTFGILAPEELKKIPKTQENELKRLFKADLVAVFDLDPGASISVEYDGSTVKAPKPKR